MSNLTLDSYDDLPYESLPLPDTHPDYLRAIARLYGVDAAPAESCRVLELGCAGGGNILPLAWYQPRARHCRLQHNPTPARGKIPLARR